MATRLEAVTTIGSDPLEQESQGRLIELPLTAERFSPELALVDPVLRQRALVRLHDPGCFRPAVPRVRRPDHLGLRRPVVATENPTPRAPAPAGPPLMRAGVVAALFVATAVVAVMASELLDRLGGRDTREGSALLDSPEAGQSGGTRLPTLPAPSPSVEQGARTSQPGPATAPVAQTFAWAPMNDASAYRIRIYRGSNRVLEVRRRETRLTLPARWRFAGRSYKLTPGSYRWYVWAVAPDGTTAIKPFVQASLTVPRPAYPAR